MKIRLTRLTALLAAIIVGASMTGCADRVAECKEACEAANKCPGATADDCSFCEPQTKLVEDIGCGGKLDDAASACPVEDACATTQTAECKSAATALNACINAVCDKDPGKCVTN